MISVDRDHVAGAERVLSDALIEAEVEPEEAIAAMMHLILHLADRCGAPKDDVLDWAVRVLDEEE